MSKYPEGLLNWSGDKAGGVKKLFYTGSGRPSGDVITTRLLMRLESWARAIATGAAGTPRAIFLIGGPGNGKTEAIEFTIKALDDAMRLNGGLRQELASKFSGQAGNPVGRLVTTKHVALPQQSRINAISIVQDASEAEPGDPAPPSEHLCNDISKLLGDNGGHVYMACVNRGVLDDALILATEQGHGEVGNILKAIIQSASLGVAAIDCWPLQGHPNMAAWPMDIESLVDETAAPQKSAARQIIDVATQAQAWPEHGACAAGEHCPFCTNRKLLAGDPHQSSFIRILRWFELSTGKRWNFRDLFSLTAYLLAGTTAANSKDGYHPCEWAHAQLSPKGSDNAKREAKRVRGLLNLLSAQYQHALFGSWPAARAKDLKRDIKELQLEGLPPLAGLHQFLALDKRKETTSTLRTHLASLVGHLDPALASPDLEVSVSGNTIIRFNDVDRRFSLSIREGRVFLQKYQCLSPLEIDLLKALEEADAKLSEESTRRRKPAIANRVQAFLRLIACRIARRSIGARAGVTRDSDVLLEFSQVVGGDNHALQVASKEVEGLLNKDRRFQVSLNTTFGEPLPSPERRVILTADIQRVVPIPLGQDDRRPLPPVRFVSIGRGARSQQVAITYELFRATKYLRKGMVPASLPRSVVALLDTTRAKLAGSVVRDEEDLVGSEIQLGVRNDVIVRSFGTFVIRKETSQ